MISISCIFCHQSQAPTVLRENGYEGKKCTSCNLIYVSPRPSLEQIANLYGHDQAHIPASTHIAQEYPKKLHAIHTLNIIKRYVPSGDLLEIGSGAGYFLSQAQREGFSPYGIELNLVQAEFIKNNLRIPCLERPLELDSFGTKKFDVIYHSDVLSHFYDPIQALQIMQAKLNPGGYMIFETGNIADIHAKYYTAFNAMQYPDHLFFFGEKSLATLLDLTGFTLKKTYSYSILPQLRIMKALKHLKGILKKNNPSATPTAHNDTSIEQSTAADSRIRTGYYAMMHLIRYSIGSILSQKEKPQTLIVVAQKIYR